MSQCFKDVSYVITPAPQTASPSTGRGGRDKATWTVRRTRINLCWLYLSYLITAFGVTLTLADAFGVLDVSWYQSMGLGSAGVALNLLRAWALKDWE